MFHLTYRTRLSIIRILPDEGLFLGAALRERVRRILSIFPTDVRGSSSITGTDLAFVGRETRNAVIS